MKITPVVIDKLLVILLTIPIIDSTLELNIYRAHNLPAIPPGHKIATKYLLEVLRYRSNKTLFSRIEVSLHCVLLSRVANYKNDIQ